MVDENKWDITGNLPCRIGLLIGAIHSGDYTHTELVRLSTEVLKCWYGEDKPGDLDWFWAAQQKKIEERNALRRISEYNDTRNNVKV